MFVKGNCARECPFSLNVAHHPNACFLISPVNREIVWFIRKNKQIKPSIKIKLYGANGTSFFLADRPNVNFLPKRERFRVLYISADATPVWPCMGVVWRSFCWMRVISRDLVLLLLFICMLPFVPLDTESGQNGVGSWSNHSDIAQILRVVLLLIPF
jgi:hypothetical protein